MPFGGVSGFDSNEGRKGNPSRQVSKQPSGGSMGKSDGSFGKHAGSSSSAGGVTYDAGAGMAANNTGGNYNVTEGKARVFGTGGAMKG